MKVDVVITYYRQANGLARLWKTILANAEDINKVFIVNDEPWPKPEREAIERLVEGSPLQVTFLDHEHKGFGATRCANEGMAQCTTDYVLALQADTLLPTGFIQKKLDAIAGAEWPMFISGPCHHVTPDSDPDSPDYLRQDGYMHLRETMRGIAAPWLFMRGVNKLIHRQGFIECGGMDERFDECNYEDYELVMRWLSNFGPSSVKWEETPVLHQGDPRGGVAPKDPYPLKSAKLLARQLITLREGNVMLMTDHSHEWSPEFACIGERHGPAVDIALPCQYPDWLFGADVKLLRCNAFHQIMYPEHWFHAFGALPHRPEALELSPVEDRDMALFERYGYVVVGRDTVDRSVRAIRKDLV